MSDVADIYSRTLQHQWFFPLPLTEPLLFFKVQREFYFNVQRVFFCLKKCYFTHFPLPPSFFRRWSTQHKILVILTSTLHSQIHMNSCCRGEQASGDSLTTVLIRGGEQNVSMSVFTSVPRVVGICGRLSESLLGCPYYSKYLVTLSICPPFLTILAHFCR